MLNQSTDSHTVLEMRRKISADEWHVWAPPQAGMFKPAMLLASHGRICEALVAAEDIQIENYGDMHDVEFRCVTKSTTVSMTQAVPKRTEPTVSPPQLIELRRRLQEIKRQLGNVEFNVRQERGPNLSRAIASGSWLIAMSGPRPIAHVIPSEAPPPPAKLSTIIPSISATIPILLLKKSCWSEGRYSVANDNDARDSDATCGGEPSPHESRQ